MTDLVYFILAGTELILFVLMNISISQQEVCHPSGWDNKKHFPFYDEK